MVWFFAENLGGNALCIWCDYCLGPMYGAFDAQDLNACIVLVAIKKNIHMAHAMCQVYHLYWWVVYLSRWALLLGSFDHLSRLTSPKSQRVAVPKKFLTLVSCLLYLSSLFNKQYCVTLIFFSLKNNWFLF